jgi:hypothetical protein
MSDSNLVLLLQLIFAGAEVNSLMARGLKFSQIAMLLDAGLQQGLIMETEDSLRLTSEGIEKMRSGLRDARIRRDGGWISPLDNFKIEKLALDDVYLPDSETALSLK